ncbi:MAG TPA: DMT family transporter [Burkholderiales bacterium]|nr:DMT family transporter [Burkholderiales bacterium]
MRSPEPHSINSRRAIAVAALLAGAVGIAFAPLLVRVSETGPVATAFWRAALALPVLWAWALADRRVGHFTAFAVDGRLMVAAGVLFAGDLAVWHWSIMLTSVANASLLANLAPIFVTLAVWLVFRQRPGGLFLAGMAVALAGTAALLGDNFRLGGAPLAGDALGVLTAMFYAGYQLAINRARARAATSTLMAWSVLFTAAALLPIALLSGDRMVPETSTGWLTLLALALVSQAAGQSLIAYAMAHLPPTFSSVGLLFQPVIAALFAWALLGEALGWVQMAGGVAVLAGIYIAHGATARRSVRG